MFFSYMESCFYFFCKTKVPFLFPFPVIFSPAHFWWPRLSLDFWDGASFFVIWLPAESICIFHYIQFYSRRSTMPLTQIFSFWFCFQLLSICYMPVGLQVTNATESDHIQSMFGAFNGNQQGFTQAWTLSRCLRESKYAI